jgi:regulator of sigma E protease
MSLFQDTLYSTFDLLLVVLGFSAIIIIHEGGHFFAARWAGIRVLAFAVGFGPALLSYRKGLGFRRGTSEPEYNKLVADAQGTAGPARDHARNALSGKVSPTEYRLNILPFGGYVKMLGQDDADPGAASTDPDSYQNCIPWKRMVVISAGVVFNIITAAILFIIVFNPAVGLRTEPARIGRITEPDRPAATAVATNAAALGVTEPGLKPGDTILSVNGDRPSHFNDFSLAVAMSPKDVPIDLRVQREGVPGVLEFAITPKIDQDSRMLSIGAPAMASEFIRAGSRREKLIVRKSLDARGFTDLVPGAKLVQIDGKPASSPYQIDAAVQKSDGKPIIATFELPADHNATAPNRVDVTVKPNPELPVTTLEAGSGAEKFTVDARHLLGLMPVLSIASVEDGSPAAKGGLKAGDIFTLIGTTEWPSKAAGMSVIRACKDSDLHVAVIREVSPGDWKAVDLKTIRTDSTGRLGFTPEDSAYSSNVVSAWPLVGTPSPAPSGAALPGLKPGSQIIAVDGKPVATLGDLRNAMKELVANGPATSVTLTVRPPTGKFNDPNAPTEPIVWPLASTDVATLSHLGWENPLDSRYFEPARFVWKSESILGAIPMGLHETNRVMMNTYVTFARLFQGTVKVEHLKGPVGIAHVGVAIADKGFIWLLFFMALISVNLAVINFLPMPIADGGHMVFLIYEQITGRPPSVRFQNAAAICGLAILGTLFLVVTFHDVTNVFTDLKRFFGG